MFTPLSDAFSSKMASARAALQLVSTPQLVEAISRRLLPRVAGCCCGLYMYLRRRRLVRQLALEQAATTTTATAVRPKGPTFDFCTTLSLRLRSLENRDFSNYFLQLLAELTTVGELPRSWCEQRLRPTLTLDPSPSPGPGPSPNPGPSTSPSPSPSPNGSPNPSQVRAAAAHDEPRRAAGRDRP